MAVEGPRMVSVWGPSLFLAVSLSTHRRFQRESLFIMSKQVTTITKAPRSVKSKASAQPKFFTPLDLHYYEGWANAAGVPSYIAEEFHKKTGRCPDFSLGAAPFQSWFIAELLLLERLDGALMCRAEALGAGDLSAVPLVSHSITELCAALHALTCHDFNPSVGEE